LVEVAYPAPVLVLRAGPEPALMNMNKTLRVAVPILLLVGVALMIPTAAADPVVGAETPLDDAFRSTTCRIATVHTNAIAVYTVAGKVEVYSQTYCI
jgi:hypothetical protein